MDMVPNQKKFLAESIEKIKKCEKAQESVCKIFGTTIWDESLFEAWSDIVQILVPNLSKIQKSLKQFGTITECDEVVLFEKATFLVISFHETKNEGSFRRKDDQKHERISNIIKQFKVNCNKVGSQISMMSIKNSSFKAVIEDFTKNTFILLVSLNPQITLAALHFNVNCARNLFTGKTTGQSKNEGSEMDQLLFNYA